MGKQMRPDTKQEKTAVDEIDTNSLIESGQGTSETNSAPAETKAPSGETKSQPAAGKPENLPIEERPRRSGDPCPRKGCQGHLGVMSTHRVPPDKPTHRIRYLSCSSCRLVGGKEVTQI